MTGQPVYFPSAPIWMAALLASQCLDNRNGREAVRWDYISGRAIYTNCSADPLEILPLGVSLQGGQTLTIWWTPGDTAYSLEIC